MKNPLKPTASTPLHPDEGFDLSEMPRIIQETLQVAFQPAQLEIKDLSHQHRFHQQSPAGQGHYQVCISTDCLPPGARLAQHRAIYEALADWLPPSPNARIHALKITLLHD